MASDWALSRTSAVTSCPWARNSASMWEPMKPVAPVIATLIIARLLSQRTELSTFEQKVAGNSWLDPTTNQAQVPTGPVPSLHLPLQVNSKDNDLLCQVKSYLNSTRIP